MILKEILVKNFRNYDDQVLDLNPKINILVGKNAQGKTNILESIYLLAITKSHRTFSDNNLIKNGCNNAKIKGIVEKNDNRYPDVLEIFLEHKGKKVCVNGLTIRKISDYISRLNVILFSPDDLDIIKGTPSIRRKFLNIEIGQLFNKYLTQLNDYNHILKNRNDYLKKITINNYDQAYLEIITNQLINKATEIYELRNWFITELNKSLSKTYQKLTGDKEKTLFIKYITSINLEGNKDILKRNLLDKYNKMLKKEILLKQTIVGPHRDDFTLNIDEKDINIYGSQGQQRIAVLCLKLSEIDIFFKKIGEYPILLLDDIFSELDHYKRNKIIRYLNKNIQIIITTTDIHNIDKKILDNATIFSVRKAIIRRRGD